ncbi:MAG: hypothetical protein MUF38_15960 [Anaerolineae bacterium]|nr:hypothetical protein [Anaerolineae bacterium]
MVLTMVLALLGLTAVSVAQDPTPPPADVQPAQTITDIIGAPENYYGTTVSFEGLVTELVNVKAFVVDDEAFLGTNQVLVINNTGRELPVWITRDARVRVTGIVHPRTSEGGLDALIANSEMNMNMGAPMEVTAEPNVEGATDVTPVAPDTTMVDPMTSEFGNVIQPLSYGVVPERLLDWTIIELVAVEDIMLTEEAE